MSSIKQAVIAAARYSSQPEEEDRRGLRLEHMLGLGTGGAILSPLLTNKPMMDLSGVPRYSAHNMWAESRPGDIILTHNKAPYSMWRGITPAISGAPYYHAEIVGRRGKTHMAGGTEYLSDMLKGQRAGVLLRPKRPLTAEQQRRIMSLDTRLGKEDYSGSKAVMTAGLRTFAPGISTKALKCKGNVCSTGPADVYRKAGIRTGLKAPEGYELASDYLRSDRYKPVGIYGKRFDLPMWDKVYNPLIRLGMASAMGGGVYKATKDIREGESLAPLAALAGAGLGGLAGWKTESVGGELNPAQHIRKNWVGGNLLAGTSKRRRIINKVLGKISDKASLTPSVALAGLGGLGAYSTAKAVYAYLRERKRKREEEAYRRASRS